MNTAVPPIGGPTQRLVQALGGVIFSIRWGLVPLYLGLYVAIYAYVVKFGQEVWQIATHVQSMSLETLLLGVLDLIDMTMIGNLVVMTTIGGYSIFVREYSYDELPNKPRWMNGIDSSTQKIKMGMSLIAVAAIHLLRAFMDAGQVSWSTIGKEVAILGTFIVLTYAYCVFAGHLNRHHAALAHQEEHK